MRAGFVSRRLLFLLLIVVFLYLSLYTWNLRYGYLNRLSEITGMEIAGWVLRPGNWVADEVSRAWRRYMHLVGVEQENERLRAAVARMALEMARLREDSARAQRLERYLGFEPPERWERQGARVIAQRLGPTGSLETCLVDKGEGDGVYGDAPVITPDGVVGRVMRVSPSTATVLLIHDPNSRIPVLGRDSRTTGIIMGQGPGQLLSVNYVPLNEPISEGEILVSSGLARVFPKGVPVARVVSVRRSDISLFKTVLAEPLVDVRNLEQVIVLTRGDDLEPEPDPTLAGSVQAPRPAVVVPGPAPVEPQAGRTLSGQPGSARSADVQPSQARKPQPAQTRKQQATQPRSAATQAGQPQSSAPAARTATRAQTQAAQPTQPAQPLRVQAAPKPVSPTPPAGTEVQARPRQAQPMTQPVSQEAAKPDSDATWPPALRGPSSQSPEAQVGE